MPTLVELQDALVNAHAAGDTAAATALANEIHAQRSPWGQLGASISADVKEGIAAQNGPSAAGAFIREAGRSVIPGISGALSGAATGAMAGAAGLNPISVAIGGIIGGAGGFVSARALQDEAANSIAPDSWAGTAQAEQDFSAQKWPSMIGGALGGGGLPGPLRAANALRGVLTAEGRQTLAAGFSEAATPAMRVASGEILDPLVSAGAGAGLGAITGGADPQNLAEQAGLGLLFNRGWLPHPGGKPAQGDVAPQTGEMLGLPAPAPEVVRGPVIRMGNGEITDPLQARLMPQAPRLGNAPEGLPVPPERGPVTRMGNGEVDVFSPARVMPMRPGRPFGGDGLPLPVDGIPAPLDGLPAGDATLLPAPKDALGLPAPQPETALLPSPRVRPDGGLTEIPSGPVIEVGGSATDAPPVQVDLPPVSAETPPEPKQIKPSLIQGNVVRLGNQLSKLEAAGKGDTDQAVKLRTRIDSLNEQLKSAVPVKSIGSRVSEVVQSGEYPFLEEVMRHGGFSPPERGINLIARNKDSKARISDASRMKLKNNAEHEDGISPGAFDDTPGGQLARETLTTLYNRSQTANRPDQIADAMGITVREFWQKLNGELGDIAKHNGTRSDQLETQLAKEESQLVNFEKAVENAPELAKATPDELGLSKGDKFTIEGEAVEVVRTTDDTVTLRDHEKFGVQTVPKDAQIPVDGLATDKEAMLSRAATEQDAADQARTRRQEDAFAAERQSLAEQAAAEEAMAESAKAADAKPADDFSLVAHKDDAEIRAEKEAAAKRAKLEELRNAPLKGSAGDLTPDIFGEGDTPLFNERRDKPASKGVLETLKAHSKQMEKSIKSSRGKTYMVIPGLDPVTAKTVYKAALDVTIKAIEAGISVRDAIKRGVSALSAHKLNKEQLRAVSARLAADMDASVKFGEGKNGYLKVELAKLSQEFAAKGITPSRGEIIRELSARWPEDAAHIRKNIDSMMDDMIFDRDTYSAPKTSNAKEWAEWAQGWGDRVRSVLDMKNTATPERKIMNAVRAIHDTIFTGLGNKMHNLADGKHTGRRSAALKGYANEHMGIKVGDDGIARVSSDMQAEVDSNIRLNALDAFAGEMDAYFKKSGMPAADRAAWKNRVTEHMIDPSRDGELASQPELKKAVEFFTKRRRERLEYMRKNNVDVGDVGERSASRVMDPMKVQTNRKKFVEQAAKAYREKWAREIARKEVEAQKFKTRGEEGDYEKYEKIQKEIADLKSRDGTVAAEAYFYGITSGERGLSSDGNDIFSNHSGHKADSHKSREFGAEADKYLGDFMFRDAFDLDMHETAAAVREVTRARMLATKTGDTIDPVGKWKELRKAMEDEGNGDMVPMAMQLIKSYLNLGGSDNPVAQKALELTHTFTQLAYLSRAGISNLGEPALIGLRTGKPVADTIRAYQIAGKNLYRRLRGASPSENQVIADALGIAQGGMNSLMGAARLQDAFGGRGKLGRLVSAFHVKTLLTDTTVALHEAAMEIGRGFISAQVKLAKDGGKLSKLALKDLNEIGISSKDLDDIAKFADGLDKAKDKKSFILQDTPEARKYRDALTLFVRTGAALDPTRGGRAQYGNSPLGSMFYSLQSFLYEFHQKVVMRHLTRIQSAATGKMRIEGEEVKLSREERTKIATDVLAGAGAIYATQFGVQLLREYMFSDPERIAKDKRRTGAEVLKQRGMAALSRTAVLGPYDLLFNMVTQARFKREAATVVLGPAVGSASELFQAVVSFYNKDTNTDGTNTAERKLARTLYNMIAAPTVGAVSATMPGRLIPGSLIQSAYHPAMREAFVKGAAGPPEVPKGPMRRSQK